MSLFRISHPICRISSAHRSLIVAFRTKTSDGSVSRSRSSDAAKRICIIQHSLPLQHESLLLNGHRFFHSSGFLFNSVIEVEGPAFAESISEGDIKWLKKKGDYVNADEIVAEIETDKTSVEVHSPQAGTIESLLVQDGSKVTAKQKLFTLKTGGAPPAGGEAKKEPPKEKKAEAPPKEKKSEPPPPKAQAPPPPRRDAGPPPSSPPPPPPRPDKPIRSSPVSDAVPRAVAPPPPSASPEKAITGSRTETRVKMNRMRLRIAQRLKDAQNTYAMLTTFNEVDMTNAIALRNKYKDVFLKKHGLKLGFMSPFVKAAAYALQDQPVVNAVIDEGEIVYRHFVDISVAVATPKGLVVPVLRNVESLNFAQIEREINAVGEKARDGKLAIEDMEGGTFTISNGGVFGSLYGTPIINPPQSAILGMHAIVDKPVAIAGKVEIRPIMIVALTYDHRLVDGREAVTFLKKIKSSVEDPTTMFLDV